MLALISGGNWNNSSNAGVWAANWNNARNNSNVNVGFRADCGSSSYPAEEQWSHREAASCLGRNQRYRALFGSDSEDQGADLMKRYGNLFDACFTPEALHEAYLEARNGKRLTRSCHAFERRLGAQLEHLHRTLHDGSYRPRPYHCFQVYEPKPRTIHAPAFRDRVVQHAIYRVVMPLFERTFIDQSFACRPGKGTHAASEYVHQALLACDGDDYVLQLDIRRFFYSINRSVLLGLIERRIKDRRLLDVMALFAEMETGKGIPIGNLLSQLYALIYLNPLDHFVKRELKVRHYARYVDDAVLIGLTRDQALAHRAAIGAFLRERLGLEYSRTSIHRVKRGVNFCGYRTWRSGRWVRKHALHNYRRAVQAGQLESAVSLLGHARHTRSLQHMLGTAKDLNHDLYHALPESHRRLHHAHRARA
jgi:retron-type reverse transcriptase